jgi:hypothetical protein
VPITKLTAIGQKQGRALHIGNDYYIEYQLIDLNLRG